ncbi:MAG: Hpt domain-containing protein [Deltaproteobacteria bacterium]|nr:Hpt domain-containing protein [Deltaproteobacteria bacterium]
MRNAGIIVRFVLQRPSRSLYDLLVFVVAHVLLSRHACSLGFCRRWESPVLDSDEEQNELIQEFLVECYEGLDKLDQDLLTLEEDPQNTEILSGIFRTFHTIKGTAGFLAFGKLEAVAHTAENLLSKLRDGALVMNTGRADALLKTVDTLRAILASIESARSEGDEDCTELLDNLKRLQQADQDGFLSSGAAPASATATSPAPPAPMTDPETKAAAALESTPEPTTESAPKATSTPAPAIAPSPASLPEDVLAARAARWASPPPSMAAAQPTAAVGPVGRCPGRPKAEAGRTREQGEEPRRSRRAPASALGARLASRTRSTPRSASMSICSTRS